MRSVLLDTSAFIAGYETSDADVEHFTVPAVQGELRRRGLPHLRLETALRTGRLKVLKPESRYAAKVEAVAAEIGETDALSPADMELLALGLQLMEAGKEPVLVSDDYSIQNVADRLGLGYTSLATRGIKRRFSWIIYCPGCRRTFSRTQPSGLCPVCGTALRRKPVGKRPAERRRRSRSRPSWFEPGYEGA